VGGGGEGGFFVGGGGCFIVGGFFVGGFFVGGFFVGGFFVGGLDGLTVSLVRFEGSGGLPPAYATENRLGKPAIIGTPAIIDVLFMNFRRPIFFIVFSNGTLLAKLQKDIANYRASLTGRHIAQPKLAAFSFSRTSKSIRRIVRIDQVGQPHAGLARLGIGVFDNPACITFCPPNFDGPSPTLRVQPSLI